jgi:O-antigen/teichoic acid export membrane protein
MVMETRSRIVLQRVVAVTLARAGAAALSLLVSIAVARLYGATGAGVLYLALAIVSVLGSLMSLGVADPVMRHVAVSRERDSSATVLLAAVLVVCAAAPVISGPALLALPLILGEERAHELAIVVVAAPAYAVLQVIMKALTALDRPLSGELLGRAGVQAALIAALLWTPATVASIGVAVIIAHGLLALAAIAACWRLIGRGLPQRSSTVRWGRRLALEGRPLVMATLLGILPQWIDVIVVNACVGTEQAGIFGAAARVAAVIGLVLVGAQAVAGPRFAALHAAGDLRRLRRLAEVTNTWVTLAAVVLLLVVWTARVQLLELFGDQFTSGSTVLLIASVGQVGNCAFGLVVLLLIMTGQGRRALITATVALGSNLLLNIALVPNFGIEGAAIASATSVLASNAVAAYYVRESLGIRPLSFRIS